MFKKKALALPGALLCAMILAAQPAAAAPVGGERVNQAQRLSDRGQALMAAQRGLGEYQQRKQQYYAGLSPSHMALDVSDVQELSQARIGQGFEMHTVSPQDLAAGRSDLAGMALPTGSWRFVVQVGDKPVGLVTVQKHEGRWQAVSFGGAGLARELDALRQVHGNGDGSNLRFIRVYQAQSDVLEVVSGKDGRPRYATLQSTRDALLRHGLSARAADGNAGLVEATQLLEPLRTAVAKNLDAQR